MELYLSGFIAEFLTSFIVIAWTALPAVLVLAAAVRGIVMIWRYYRSSYYRSTQKPYLRVLFNKGRYGEYLTYNMLRQYEKDGARFLFNLYLPKEDGQTTEIDLLMIHNNGLFVFESKNYSGWIFGREWDKSWCQTLPAGRKGVKNHFYNPILQNRGHIAALRALTADDLPVHSVIVFSERCTLKNVTVKSDEIRVITRDALKSTVEQIMEASHAVLENERIQALYEQLYPFSQVDKEVKKRHIDAIVNHGVEPQPAEPAAEIAAAPAVQLEETSEAAAVQPPPPRICPRCGGRLILRTAGRGAHAGERFWGCANFPRCRYTESLETKNGMS